MVNNCDDMRLYELNFDITNKNEQISKYPHRVHIETHILAIRVTASTFEKSNSGLI